MTVKSLPIIASVFDVQKVTENTVYLQADWDDDKDKYIIPKYLVSNIFLSLQSPLNHIIIKLSVGYEMWATGHYVWDDVEWDSLLIDLQMVDSQYVFKVLCANRVNNAYPIEIDVGCVDGEEYVAEALEYFINNVVGCDMCGHRHMDMTAFDGLCQDCLEDKNEAARVIQSAWHNAINNPHMKLCRERLLSEFAEMAG